jgi:hypothetical protein
MYRNIWERCHGAICSISFLDEYGIKTYSATGFLAGEFIISDDSLFKVKRAHEVLFRFVLPDAVSIHHELRIEFGEFKERIVPGTQEEKVGFSLFQVEEHEISQLPSLYISQKKQFPIGHPIAVLGFQFDQDNLSIKSGIISSNVMLENANRYIQFDCPLRHGNSGSPLIDAETGEVIGVVGYRLASIVQSYDMLNGIINDNLKILRKVEGKISIQEIDPVQVLIANQFQLKMITREIFRTAGTNYGYAIDTSKIAEKMKETSMQASIFRAGEFEN